MCSSTLGASSTDFRCVFIACENYEEIAHSITQSTVAQNGQTVTTMWRTLRPNKEDRVAKLEWSANGGLGRVVMGKVGLTLCARETTIFHIVHFLERVEDG